jgi:peptide/nickel transport system permease protein
MLWDRYLYSMTIFAISLFIAVILSYLFMIIFHVSPKKIKRIILSLSTLIESLPDAFIIISLQLLVILIYKKTNILVAQIAVFEEDIYLLPIICLSIIPTFLLFKAIMFLLKEEESKLYIDLAKMKGLTSLRIFLVHTFRNVLYSLFYRSKIIFSFMLSNLFLIEVVFNMDGALQFLLRARGPEFIVAAVLLFTPFFLFVQNSHLSVYAAKTRSSTFTANR